MTMDVNTFRILRRAFKDPQRYPNAQINHYLSLAYSKLDSNRWGEMLDQGCMDFASHYMVIDEREAQAAERGAVPGNAAGRVASKSVGGVSVSFDLGGTEEQDGGWWNTTTYGTAFLRQARMCGSGGVQITGNCGVLPPWTGEAWPGPIILEY